MADNLRQSVNFLTTNENSAITETDLSSHIQQFIIGEIVVQNDLNPEACGTTVPPDIVFEGDDSQSNSLFNTNSLSNDITYEREVSTQSLKTEKEDTLILDNSQITTPLKTDGSSHDQISFNNSIQAQNLLLHNDSNSSGQLLLGNTNSNFIPSNMGSILLTDSSSNQSFSISNQLPSIMVQTENSLSNDAHANYILQYAGNMQHTQLFPSVQPNQTALNMQPVISDKPIEALNTVDNNSYLTTDLTVLNNQPILIASQNIETLSNQSDLSLVTEQATADSQHLKPLFFIQGGNSQNYQLLQQVLSMWSSGHSEDKITPPASNPQTDVLLEENTYTCSQCAKAVNFVSSSIQTHLSCFNLDDIDEIGNFCDTNNLQDVENLPPNDVDDHKDNSVETVDEEIVDTNLSASINPEKSDENESVYCEVTNNYNSSIRVEQSSTCNNIDDIKEVPVVPENHTSISSKEPMKRRKLTLMKMGPLDHECKFCGQSFKRLADLALHVKDIHPDESDNNTQESMLSVSFTVKKVEEVLDSHYVCDICNLAFINFYSLRMHSNSHDNLHKCSTCELVYSTEEKLHMHCNVFHAKGMFSCTKCGETFAKDDQLDSHQCYHQVTPTISCKLCKNLFFSQEEFKDHVNMTHKQQKMSANNKKTKLYECDNCSYACYSWAVMNAHIRIHTGVKPFTCHVCFKKFRLKHILMRHLQCHESVKKHVCKVCENRYSDLRTLNLHMKIHSASGTHKCGLCDKEFQYLTSLQKHEQTHNHGYHAKSHQCSYCGKLFTNKYSLISHTRLHTGERPYICTVCNQGFVDKRTLKYHSVKHTNDKQHQCTICGKRYTHSSGLKNHQRIHEIGPVYPCSTCDKMFGTAQALETHSHMHKETKPYICDICAKPFISYHSLRRHTFKHSEDRPFVCTICLKAFKEKYVLQVHERIHMEGLEAAKPYKCSDCGQTFRQSCSLTVHMRRHTGERPYKCQTCSQAFTTASSLKRHQRLHTGECPYACDQCDKRFRLIPSLRSHIQKHHKDNVVLPTSLLISNINT